MQEQRHPRTNGNVARMNRYLPFSVSHEQIYEEYQTDEDSLSLDTEALKYILSALHAGARCIVLTGDAGHGKTHLCRKLLSNYLGYGAAESRKLLLTQCDGRSIIPPIEPSTQTALRIHKDFSEIDPDSAAKFLEKYGNSQGESLVLCANEGRLRAIISSQSADKVCVELRHLFKQTFETGLSSTDNHLHIVNLNFQSIAAHKLNGSESLVRRTLGHWIGDGRRWTSSCNSCSLELTCPIRKNRELLGDDGTNSHIRINKLERFFSTVERLGHVITIREMLMLIAYIVTGGLTCEDVRRKNSRSPELGWQSEYAFYNLLFCRPTEIPEDRLFRGIPILEDISKLDPGKIARRSVDEKLLNGEEVYPTGQLDLLYSITIGNNKKIIDAANGIDEVIGTPQSRTDLSREAEYIKRVVAGLRRRSFFDGNNDTKDMLSRLGFKYGDDFLEMLEGEMKPQAKLRMKNLVVAGLHGIQGLRLSSTATTLFLVDPAFGRASADAAIIARQIPIRDISLLSEKAAWGSQETKWLLTDSVDWLDRRIVIRIDDKTEEPLNIALDLMAFECVIRSASGFISEGFYAHQMKRIRAFLGKLAERGRTGSAQISLFMNGKVSTVSLDMGVIQVSGGA
ncbi:MULTISPECIES: hypothetical protein [Serratia]|uniref:hypothetical protein n=1 Tax=Serratia TaxID=613 RepID=UPI0028071429|nr:hypothetical protein [Serratia marcescens]